MQRKKYGRLINNQQAYQIEASVLNRVVSNERFASLKLSNNIAQHSKDYDHFLE
jgi:hypothetical protein